MESFFISYFSYSQIIVVMLSFFILEKLYKQNWRKHLLFLFITVTCVIVARGFSTLDLLVLFFLLFIFTYRLYPEKNPMQTILSITFSAMIEVVTSFASSKALGHIYFNLDSGMNKNLVLLILSILMWGFCVGFAFLLRDKLYPYLIRIKKLNLLAIFLMIIVLTYQTISMIESYANNQYLFSMILLFYFIVAGLIFLVLRSLSKNAILEAEAKNSRIISELQTSYVDEVKKQYQEIQKFRHDYTNLLSTVNYYLEHNKIGELKEFFATDMEKANAVLKENNLILDSLQNIESIGIRSIFYTKLLLAQEKNIDLQVEIRESFPEFHEISTVTLVRIFGIFLDNAIEELSGLEEGTLTIVAFKEQNQATYIIQNTTRKNFEDLKQLKQEGFSTKGKNRGLGLSNVEELLQNESHILLETRLAENQFIQQLTILSEVKEDAASLYL